MNHGLPPRAVSSICDVLARYPSVSGAILYGSRAKGTFKPGSDIDLTLTGHGLDFTLLRRIEDEIDDLLLPWKLDLSSLDDIQNESLLDHIRRVGIPLYGNAANAIPVLPVAMP